MLNGRRPVAWLIMRIMVEASRSWRGPWRGPGRLVVPPSQGTPISPICTSSASSTGTCGRRMKVGMPAKRGRSMPDSGR